jgi:hypothetical protein
MPTKSSKGNNGSSIRNVNAFSQLNNDDRRQIEAAMREYEDYYDRKRALADFKMDLDKRYSFLTNAIYERQQLENYEANLVSIQKARDKKLETITKLLKKGDSDS